MVDLSKGKDWFMGRMNDCVVLFNQRAYFPPSWQDGAKRKKIEDSEAIIWVNPAV